MTNPFYYFNGFSIAFFTILLIILSNMGNVKNLHVIESITSKTNNFRTAFPRPGIAVLDIIYNFPESSSLEIYQPQFVDFVGEAAAHIATIVNMPMICCLR